MVKQRFQNKTNYIPHAIPSNVYHQLTTEQQANCRRMLFGDNADKRFIGLWVNRNARRKMPNDVLDAWKTFAREVKQKHKDSNPLLIMHTDPRDNEGPNLLETVKMLNLQHQVAFSVERLDFEKMNMLYNAVDFVVNIATNEGFGLSTLEAMMCKKPIIALKTGGLTKQVMNDDGTHNGIALDPEVRNLVGSQQVPYIYEDHVSNNTLAKAFMTMYEYGPETRTALGEKAYKHARKNYDINKVVQQWDETLSNTINQWKTNKETMYKSWECLTY